MLGTDPGAPPLPEIDPTTTPRVALEQALLPALERTPCLVTLSGGRDSSAVLAVAAHVARREGLPVPIPVTVRFKQAPGTSEREWQELVIRHLALEEWHVLEVDDDLDLVGPLATRLLLRHGVRHPAHACLFALLLQGAQGGSLLTGVAGDTMFGSWRYWRVLDVLALRRRPTGEDLLLAGYGLAPAPIRRFAARVRTPDRPWLTPGARARLREVMGDDAPRSFNAHLGTRLRARSLRSTVATMQLLGETENALAIDPLCEPTFVAALARAGGRTGLGSRTEIMRSLFGDLLPDALIARADKARFPFAYFRTTSREFARSWSGRGLDPELIDAETLRRSWLELLPNGYGAMALQQAWLASQPDRIGQQANGLFEQVEAPRPA
jgi:asparagine synthase (glutamine-hydrolysing)